MERYFESVNCKNIKEIVYNSAKKFAENVAFVIKHKNEKKEVSYESITYKKLLQDVNEFGTKLYDMGLKNKRVAIVGRNRYEWVVAHLSNLLGGIVSIPLDKELQVDELESCLERSKADVIVFDEKYIDNIEKIEKEVVSYARQELSKLDYLDLYMSPNEENHSSVISFNIKGVHPHDVASMLDFKGVCVRSGNHCAQPLLRYMGIDSTCRASFSIYNTKEDVDRLVDAIKFAYSKFERFIK